jgi:hypothetical protein
MQRQTDQKHNQVSEELHSWQRVNIGAAVGHLRKAMLVPELVSDFAGKKIERMRGLTERFLHLVLLDRLQRRDEFPLSGVNRTQSGHRQSDATHTRPGTRSATCHEFAVVFC